MATFCRFRAAIPLIPPLSQFIAVFLADLSARTTVDAQQTILYKPSSTGRVKFMVTTMLGGCDYMHAINKYIAAAKCINEQRCTPKMTTGHHN
ncbi:hypothetical protein T11_9647 [Trichinella zimbabwensis]|uniref:PiggyBac transposable element-derived protein domain-containing protein n=1 Tax=Trichinella zimbabwensis TaxID=268475 RepID=A0A0V1GZT7_9BILA|nr:hypothetical protein T11_9647 [Trichinella zimbabwensis]